MAHTLNVQAGQAALMYVGKVPWHGLGTRLEQPATAAQAIQAAKLGWQVSKIQLSEKHIYDIRENYAVVREDRWPDHSDGLLGMVGHDYTPLQNREAFCFFDPIVGSGAAVYHTAGALGNGERVWIMAKLPTDIQVIGDDITQEFLLLANSHDGRSAVEIKFTPVRVVCQNTLTLALSQGPTLRIPHSKDMHRRLVETGALLGAIQLRFAEIAKTFKDMAARQVNRNAVQAYLKTVFPDPSRQIGGERYEKMLAQAQTERAIAEYLFDQGHGNNSGPARGTLWAAYNGVTEYVDHRRYSYLPMQLRWGQLWFGMGNSVKERAYQTAVNMLRAGFNNSTCESDALSRILARFRRRLEQPAFDTVRPATRYADHDTDARARISRQSSRSHTVGARDFERVG